MGKFNSDDHCIYYCGQEFFRTNKSSSHSQRESLKCSPWMQSQKRKNELHSFLKQTIQHHSNPTLCPNHQCQKAEVEWFYADLQDVLELTPKKKKKKDIIFIIGDWNAKVGSQEIPGASDKFGLGVQNEAGE